MRFRTIAWLLPSLLCYPALASVDCKSLGGKTLDATIIKVADGDTATVKIKSLGRKVKVRFYGADTPESPWKGHWPEQDFSVEAKEFTVKKLKDKNVKVTFTGDGTYSRCVGEVYLNGESHSLALIRNGYAWWYSKYAPDREDLKNAHALARRSKIGLWANSAAQAPWTFRWQHFQ